MAIKIIIADDHQIFREGLINLLSGAENIRILAQAENGKDVLQKTALLNPDIVIMDIGMPLLNGIEATRMLASKHPDVKVIALSMHFEKHFIKGMFEAGAYSYLYKNCTYDELIKAIVTVSNGHKYVSEKITEVLIDDYIGKSVPGEEIRELSKREIEVLKLIAEGKSNSEIAEKLFVSAKTIGTHKKNILEKLKLHTTTDLVKYAIKKGMISIW